MRKITTILAFVGLIALSSFVVVLQLKVDTSKSKVTFEIGNMKVKTVEGGFDKMTGKITFDPNDLKSSRFQACILVSSLNTGNEKRDEHLMKEDFFEEGKYPKICFISSKISKATEGYTAEGKLTMHGVTKVVKIPFSYTNEVFKGSLKLNRYDYKVGEETGTFMVSNEVNIQIETHLVNNN